MKENLANVKPAQIPTNVYNKSEVSVKNHQADSPFYCVI